MQDFILTIGCEYGSGGPDIAKMIAKDLGYPCYDRAIIDRIIEETGLSKEMTEKLEAGVEVRGRSQVLQNTASPSKYSILTDRVVYLQTQIIRKLAGRGPVRHRGPVQRLCAARPHRCAQCVCLCARGAAATAHYGCTPGFRRGGESAHRKERPAAARALQADDRYLPRRPA